MCRPLFVVENNRLRIRKKHINDLHDPNYGWTNLMQQVGVMTWGRGGGQGVCVLLRACGAPRSSGFLRSFFLLVIERRFWPDGVYC